MNEPILLVHFNKNGDKAKVSEKSLKIIRGLMKASGITEVTITSTARDSYEQAKAMYENLEVQGVKAQKKLYGSAGDKVIDVYAASKAAKKKEAQIISDMKQKIDAIGPGKVSNHAADTSKLNVIDISPRKLKPDHKKAAFEKAIKESTAIARYFLPPTDPAIHIEINQ